VDKVPFKALAIPAGGSCLIVFHADRHGSETTGEPGAPRSLDIRRQAGATQPPRRGLRARQPWWFPLAGVRKEACTINYPYPQLRCLLAGYLRAGLDQEVRTPAPAGAAIHQSESVGRPMMSKAKFV